MLEQLTAGQLQTVCPVIGSFIETLSDSKLFDNNAQSREVLSPFLGKLLNSRRLSSELPRMFCLADFAVRKCAPVGLRLRNLINNAVVLESLVEITDKNTARLAEQAIIKMPSTAYAYGAVSYAANAVDAFMVNGVPVMAANACIQTAYAYSSDFAAEAIRRTQPQLRELTVEVLNKLFSL